MPGYSDQEKKSINFSLDTLKDYISRLETFYKRSEGQIDESAYQNALTSLSKEREALLQELKSETIPAIQILFRINNLAEKARELPRELTGDFTPTPTAFVYPKKPVSSSKQSIFTHTTEEREEANMKPKPPHGKQGPEL